MEQTVFVREVIESSCVPEVILGSAENSAKRAHLSRDWQVKDTVTGDLEVDDAAQPVSFKIKRPPRNHRWRKPVECKKLK